MFATPAEPTLHMFHCSVYLLLQFVFIVFLYTFLQMYQLVTLKFVSYQGFWGLWGEEGTTGCDKYTVSSSLDDCKVW